MSSSTRIGIALVQLIMIGAFIALIFSQMPRASAQSLNYPPEWIMLTRIAQHVNAGVDTPFDGREDFVLLLPFEYGFNDRGACVDYDVNGDYYVDASERPSIAQVYWSVRVVELGMIDEKAELFEDGSCVQSPYIP